jgi:hypothetical protein
MMLLHLFIIMAGHSYAYEPPAVCEPRPAPIVRECAADEGCEEVWTFGKEVPLS